MGHDMSVVDSFFVEELHRRSVKKGDMSSKRAEEVGRYVRQNGA
jgi:hypothetical protein